VDNTTTVAYIDNLGGTVSKDLVDLAKNLWMWYLERNIHVHITVQHLPGVQNEIADAESRTMRDQLDYQLNPVLFNKIVSLCMGSNSNGPICISADHSVPTLFQLAARSLCSGNKCLPVGLVSYTGLCQPTLEYDREGSVTGQNPTGMHCVSGTSLEDTAIVPSTATCAGSSTTSDNTQSDSTEQGPNESNPTTIAMWHISGRIMEARSFRKKLPHSYSSLGEPRLTDLMTHSSGSGIACVIQGVQIPFLVL
jgi:hypothetical protein